NIELNMTAKFVVQNNTVYHPGWTGMNGTSSLIRTGEYSYVVPADFCKSAMSVLMVATRDSLFSGNEIQNSFRTANTSANTSNGGTEEWFGPGKADLPDPLLPLLNVRVRHLESELAVGRGARRRLVAPALLAVCLVGCGWAKEREPAPWSSFAPGDVTRIRLQRGTAEPEVELERRGTSWFMVRPYPGPAEVSAVHTALGEAAGVRAEGRVSGEAARGVDATTGTSVELGGPGGPLAHFIVGAGGLVRQANGQDVYRVATSLTAAWSRPPRDWRSRQITDIAQLRAIEWQVRAGTFRFERTGDVWAPVPPQRVPGFDPARLNWALLVLTRLRADDFAAPGTDAGITPESPRLTLYPAQGEPVVLRTGRKPGPDTIYLVREGDPTVHVVPYSEWKYDFVPSAVQRSVPKETPTSPPPRPSP
ncbi:MAG TPA: hypothetical protein VEZ71_00790, partial [Archangium sp.]|nr:hypothetical protein [Archangium sp.]